MSTYIREKKINMAKNLLRFNEYSIIDIANRLFFSSQSHFIQQFREIVGMTPKNIAIKIISFNGKLRKKNWKRYQIKEMHSCHNYHVIYEKGCYLTISALFLFVK